MDIAKSKRPEWAAAGTFPEAWRATVRIAQDTTSDWHRAFAESAHEGLAAAHVITLERDQVEALPRPWETYEESAAMFCDVRLPFDPVYLSLDRASLDLFSPPAKLLGALIGVPGVGPEHGKGLEGWDGLQPLIIPFYESGGHGVMADAWCFATREGWAGSDLLDEIDLPDDVSEVQLIEARSLKADAAQMLASVLYFLESANVELVEGSPSRQERREVERRGGRIAFTVLIRPPKKRPRSDGSAEHPDWTHRWEVRGHYKHFPVGTRIADSKPEKLAMHPTLGQCRRIWCPPHVKGPQDKPLVPKIRTLAPVTQAPAVSDSRV